MDYSTVLPYFVSVVALTAAPGPLMALLVVRSINKDSRGAAAFAAGLCAGDVFAAIAVATGIGVWAQSNPDLLSLGKYLGVAYLLWMAFSMWHKRTELDSNAGKKESLITSATAGFAICLGNPSTLLIYMLLLPILIPDSVVTFEQMALVIVVTTLAVCMVFFGTILLAKRLSTLLTTPASSDMASRITAGTMAITSAWILVS